MTDPEITLALRRQTPQRPAVRMNWRDLLFLHFPIAPEAIQPLLPAGLKVDTYRDPLGVEWAWLGLVAFRMERVMPRGMPYIRPCADFPETNIRTYCVDDSGTPGVWFFSLDAANPFACEFARRFYSLPYCEATMAVEKSGNEISYRSRRWRAPHGDTDLTAVLGEPGEEAVPGSFEFFLLERYLLFSHRRGRLYRGQVFHRPYPTRHVAEVRGSSGLFDADRLVTRPFDHAIFSAGVDVVAGRIQRIG